jgi:hypothetical protein
MTMAPPTPVEYRDKPSTLPHRAQVDVNGNSVPAVTIETITAVDAERYLSSNRNIRKLRPRVVDRYASDMAEGRWYVGTSVIGFDENNDLRCGQHRLTACVQSGAPFTTIVARFLTQAAIDNDDQGLKRTTADVLRSKGEGNSNSLSAVITNSWRWDNGLILHSTPLTQAQVGEYLDANPGLRDATAIAQSLVVAPVAARVSAIGPFIHRIRQIDTEFADMFVRGLHTGADLPENDPILRLRQYYLAKRGTQYGRPSRQHELALCVKAWNSWLAGRPVKALRWGRGTSGQEEFPLLNGPSGRPWPFPEVQAAQVQAATAAELARSEQDT